MTKKTFWYALLNNYLIIHSTTLHNLDVFITFRFDFYKLRILNARKLVILIFFYISNIQVLIYK